MDYNEVVAKLTIEVMRILGRRCVNAAYDDVYAWLEKQGVHHSDDAKALADAWMRR